MSDDINLPPLPPTNVLDRHLPTGIALHGYDADQMLDFATAAVLADREQRGEPVAWMYRADNGDGTESTCVHIGSELPAYVKPLGAPVPLYAPPLPVEQRKPLKQEMLRQMRELVGTYEEKGAFVDGWTSAEQAHGIGEGKP